MTASMTASQSDWLSYYFYLYTDPREGKPTPDSWVVGPVLKIVSDFEKSVQHYSLIPMGTPDPFRPDIDP